jgi:predicted RNase H-like HicB family nuclease
MERYTFMDAERHAHVQVRALVYREDGDYVAHALEMDLVAQGKTEKAALAELQHMVACQVSFALQRGELHLIRFPAPREYFDRWEAAQAQTLDALATDKPLKMEARARAVFVPITKKQLKSVTGADLRFARMPDPVCA